MDPDLRLGINTRWVAHRVIDGEVIAVHFHTGIYYMLDGAGARIWDLVARNSTLRESVDLMVRSCQGEPQTIASAVTEYIDELYKEGLVVPVDCPLDRNPELASLSEVTESADRPVFQTPRLEKHADMRDLLLLDPIHEVDERGWPTRRS